MLIIRQGNNSLCILLGLICLLPILSSKAIAGPTHVSGRIASDTVWTLADHPYIVDSSVEVFGNSADQIVQLTIEAGVEVQFKNGTQLRIGRNPQQRAKLVARGTAEKPIVFTGVSATPGAWNGLHFGDGAEDGETSLEGCIVEHGGRTIRGNIFIENSAPVIQHCTIRESSVSGIRLSNHRDTRPLLAHNRIVANAVHGIKADRELSTPTLRSNVITQNGRRPVTIGAGAVTHIARDNVLKGNKMDRIFVHGETIRGRHRWPALLSYDVAMSVSVRGARGAETAVLELMPGVTLRFADNTGLTIGGSNADERGRLVARGTLEQPIVFTSQKGQAGRMARHPFCQRRRRRPGSP